MLARTFKSVEIMVKFVKVVTAADDEDYDDDDDENECNPRDSVYF